MSIRVVRPQIARVFVPLLQPKRYKAAWGGRGSGKSHTFADLAVARATRDTGFRMVCIREVQKTLKDSAKRLIEDKIQHHGVGDIFDAQTGETKTPGGGTIIYNGMQDHNSESIKSLEGFDVAWVEEAQTLSPRSLELLRPTIRKPGSEIWFSWNPRSASDPVDEFFRGQSPPENAVIIRANYSDNPWFPEELESERLHDRNTKPDRYRHIWEGDYEPMAVGAIWSRKVIHEGRTPDAPEMSRIVVAIDPAVSSEPGSDYHGIVVCGLGSDGRGYVLADYSVKGTPEDWAKRAIAAYDEFEADAMVAEINQGGDMVKHTIKSIRQCRVIEVRASKGKHVRAEPISALYYTGKISHVGTFPELEQQMCLMTAGGYEGEGSPDRVDAMVWGFTELFPKIIRRAPAKAQPQRQNNHYNPYRRLA